MKAKKTDFQINRINPGTNAGFNLLFVLLAADCIWMLAVTRSLRHGRENIEKLLKLAEQS